MQEGLHTQLRSVEGLGYIVDGYFSWYDNIGVYQILVQTEKFHPSHVLQSINSWLWKFFEETVMSSEFMDNFRSVMDDGEKNEFSRWRRSNLWRHVMSGYQHMIHLNKQMSGIFDSFDEGTFSYYYYNLLLNRFTRRKLTIVMYGEGKEIELDVDCIMDYNQLDQTKTSAESLCV